MTSPRSLSVRGLVLFAVLQLVLAVIGLLMRPDGGGVAGWWPASGVAVIMLLRFRRRDWPGLLVAIVLGTAAANAMVLLRNAPVALLFGFANLTEAVITAWLFQQFSGGQLRTVADVWRLGACSFVGSFFGAVLAGTVSAVLENPNSFLPVLSVFVVSHPSGVLLVAPLALTTRIDAPTDRVHGRDTAPTRPRRLASRLEIILQFGLTIVVTAGIFAQPALLPLTFVPAALMVWAAVRFTPRVTVVEVLVVATIVSSFTVIGLGPFAAASDAAPVTWLSLRLAQLYLLTLVIIVLTLALTVHERDLTTARLSAREDLFRRTFDEAMLGMLLVRRDPAGHWLVSRANVVARELLDLHGEHPDLAASVSGAQQLLDTVRQGCAEEVQTTSGRHLALSISPAMTPGGSVDHIAIQMADITEQHVAQDRLRTMAMSDPLTGLANRALLVERLGHWVDLDAGEGSLLLMFLDLDDFKNVNDSAGHVVGDEVLLAIANRLTTACPREATVARLGGDEFVVLVPNAGATGQPPDQYARTLADELIAAVSQPLTIADRHYRVGASVGMTLSSPGCTTESLLREADSAMFQAKREGKNRQAIFSQALQDAALRRITLDAQLHQALEREEFELFVQPVVDLLTGSIVGGECLLRWHHPERGTLPPLDWLDVAEGSSVVTRLGSWVVRESCRIASRWPRQPNGEPITVHANVSGHQLGVNRLVDDVSAALAGSGLPASHLVLELTETELAREAALVTAEISRLRAEGVRLAADDVGTGYSSLTRLTDLPIDILKIDRTFVDRMTRDERARVVVEGLITLGSAMDLEVVAEGVETCEQATRLRDLGCSAAQGFLWSAAVSAPEFERLLATEADPRNDDLAFPVPSPGEP